ncbi:IS110 family transposase, partial [Streptomyces tuirus]|uniref:IS110 family transposase n=2 Tax=Streptomyces tuirus TaxID=68278 RepID=UPI003C2DC301
MSSDRNGTLSEVEETHMNAQVPCLWVGIDASKAHHWWVAIDDTGTTIWSRKVSNDEAVILAGLGEVLAMAAEVRWAVD